MLSAVHHPPDHTVLDQPPSGLVKGARLIPTLQRQGVSKRTLWTSALNSGLRTQPRGSAPDRRLRPREGTQRLIPPLPRPLCPTMAPLSLHGPRGLCSHRLFSLHPSPSSSLCSISAAPPSRATAMLAWVTVLASVPPPPSAIGHCPKEPPILSA
jgi:hypothetical protein